MAKKVLIIGDAPSTPTGFSTVIRNIFKYFDKEEWELHQLGINYYGDPHSVEWKLYPAAIRGDVWGFGRISEFSDKNFDLIFILNDAWVLSKYMETLKQSYGERKIPPIVVYFPVDSYGFDDEWFKDFNIVNKTVVYTNFGHGVVTAAKPNLDVEIIPHGVDTEIFHKIDMSRKEIKSAIFPNTPDFIESFIVLNANRNQPRKRIDITMEAFKLFSDGKPKNVKVYMHMGVRDASIDIIKYSRRLGIDDRLIITNKNQGVQMVSTAKLNMIYNAADVGINTSLGEGWGLVNVEHSVTGIPQVVPAHSACRELYEDCGLLVPINQWLLNSDTMTTSGLVKPEDVAYQLEMLYTNGELYDSLSKKALYKFTSPEYDWKNISKRFEEVFKSVL